MNGTRKLVLILIATFAICLCLTGCGKKHKNPVSVKDGDNITISPNDDIENNEDKIIINYTFKTIVEKELFELSISVPEDCPIKITDFELWTDNQKIGERTPANKTIRNLTINTENIINIFIRLYDNVEFVADCPIDPKEESGILVIYKQ